jgi:RimJ/RimL family protein N-acetyltransferase
MAEGAGERFRYLSESPAERPAFDHWLKGAATSSDPMFWAVIDRATSRCQGRQALMRIVPEHGVIEVGSILWNPPIARSRVATEALYLHARFIFDDLGYRRLEWKCNALNAPSRRAAERFGFTYEGLFRQHMVVKGENRDTAWFAMTDADWPARRVRFERWLDPANFDAQGRQLAKL